MNRVPYVKPHSRETKTGKKTVVKGHHRKSKQTRIPVRTSNPSVTGYAQYDEVNKNTHLAIVDQDKHKITTVTQSMPFKATEIVVEEQPGTLGINIKGKKGSQTLINQTDIL